MAERYRVTASELNFRSEPSLQTRENILVVLPQDSIVTRLEIAENPFWWQVKATVHGQEIVGFVASEFLLLTDPTLLCIVETGQTVTMAEFRTNRSLVVEVQKKLRNFGLYPGGPWIDGILGSDSSRTRQGLDAFCDSQELPHPTESNAIDPRLAKALLDTRQIKSILDAAQNRSQTRQKLADIQAATASVELLPFLSRTIRNSPFEFDLDSYPDYLAQQPDGIDVVSYGSTFTLPGSGETVSFSDYPSLGAIPTIDKTGLDFLNSGISHACACVGSFTPESNSIKMHWLGKQALTPVEFLSSTKIIGLLNTISLLNAAHPQCDVDNCVIGFTGRNKRVGFPALVADMFTYENRIASSNQIGAMFKRFSTRQELEDWTQFITGNQALTFKGYYGDGPFIANPIIFDTTLPGDRRILSAAPEVGFGPNSVSAYDLVRLISMLGWHLHLPEAARLPAAQWISLESVVRGMGLDAARYVDIALETLGLLNVVTQSVVISKLGYGNSALTYVALVRLVDRRPTPNKLRTLAMALWADAGDRNTRDVNMAAAVTEIMRRIFTEELA